MTLDTEILDIEREQDDDSDVLIEYDITSYPSDFTLSGLAKMWKDGDIAIPDYQREFVWSIKQSSLLIESFLIGLPVPPVFFYVDDFNKNLVIDGQQRLLSIFFFFEGYFGYENEKGKRQTFRLTGLSEKNPYYNKRFIDLDEKDRRKLETSVLRAINIRQLSPKEQTTSVYHIFERLNTGGTPLKPQEIRNCVFRGEFLNKLRELNENKHWRSILGKKLIDKHQNDVELILRAFGLCYHLSEYDKPMKEFLSKVAKRYQNQTSGKVETFAHDFLKTTQIINEKLRPKPFSVRGPLNTSLFDSIFCTVLNSVNNLPNDLSDRYEQLLNDETFFEYTTLATTDAKIVKERFAYVKNFLINK
ncbi:DUF262 domain-containing protein [Gaoshiqia sediminis]|uniref:DUF262 domain-containing protein n=1 Tax=Gaoshiqia sediminis TaxID=2986998 RepID=A0AA41Y3H1_9BACT|nr:DUF262 domain-containing protein [Gaoshiqia sediminis]MCW0482766.1 DUF262 domain-containing protein [Gaoshiqia sediminis]